MKKYLKFLPLLFISFFLSLAGFAQDKKEVDISIGTEKNDSFFASPWVWVVGAAVFILLLVAILRSGGSKSTE